MDALNFMYDGADVRGVDAMKRRTIKMHALGCPFHLGDLYDSRNDHILTGNKVTSKNTLTIL